MRTGDLVIITEDRGDYGRTGVLLDPCPSPGSTAASVLIDGVRTTVPIHELRPATAEEQRAHVAGQRRRIEGGQHHG